MNIINKYCIAVGLMLGLLLSPCSSVFAQSSASDSSSAPSDSHKPVYHVNYWVSVPIIIVGGAGGLYYTEHAKDTISTAELAAAQSNPNNVPSFDRWSLHQNIALVPTWDKYASIGQITGAVMPFLLLIDHDIRQDWLPDLTIGLEVNMVTLGIYSLSPLGPTFQSRYRPLVYYPKADAVAAGIYQGDGNNTKSFYSGHVASVAASSFFMAKVYCDYHPDANQYLAYSFAAVPPLIMGYIRIMTLDHFPSDIAVGMAVGTLCGVLIPELHKIGDKNLSIGAYSSPTTGTGLTLNWDMGSNK
jgi:membrane-associated phospholipid phosphatase